jgi:endonuclease/exonuclease/phosphatase family metal-dependent hydrolase
MNAKILSFNVANSLEDEKKPEFRFGARLEKICDLIRSKEPDIVCIQEIRECLDPSGTYIMSAFEIASRMARMTNLFVAGVFMVNPSSITFARSILYNPNRFFPLQCWGEWCSHTPYVPSGGSMHRPKNIGVGVQYGIFANIIDREKCILGDERILIANMHYPLKLNEKLYTNKYLLKKIPEISGGMNTIICGDFNTYFETEGTQQLDELKSKFCCVSDHIPITYSTFPYWEKTINSKLDHVLTYPHDRFITKVDATDITINWESDHYLIEIDYNSHDIDYNDL